MRLARVGIIAVLGIVLVASSACGNSANGGIVTTDYWLASSLCVDNHYCIVVYLKPTDMAQANTIYQVDLYEQGQLRDTSTVSWNQPEINVKDSKRVEFPASADEYNAYVSADISHIFRVEVHE